MKKLLVLVFLLAVLLAYPLAPHGQRGSFVAAGSSKQHVVQLLADGKTIELNFANYEIKTKSFAILSANRKRIKGRTVEDKIDYASRLIENGAAASTALKTVFAGLDKDTQKIFNKIEVAPTDAKMRFDTKNDMFFFYKEKAGKQIDKEAFFENLFYTLASGRSSMEIRLDDYPPRLTVRELERATHLRSAFETSYNTSKPERKTNVYLAAKKLDSIVVYPGQIFSFNKATGKRSKENGYKMSKVIFNGQLAEGVGGGVCQVSTTLYNAALTAGLDVVWSRGHSLPIAYVDAGLDAMVSDGGSDLIIKNNLSLPFAIKTIANGNTLRIEIFGENMNGVHYSLTSEHVEDFEKKPTEYKKVKGAKAGTILREGFDGFAMQSYRHKFVGGILEKTEHLRKTNYDSISEIIATS